MEENNTITAPNDRGMLDKLSFAILSVVAFLVPIFFLPVAFISSQFATSLLFGFGIILSALIYIVSALMSGSLEIPQPAKYMLWLTGLVPLVYVLAGVSNGFSRMVFLGYTFDISTVGFVLLSFVYLFLVSTLFKSKNRIFYSYIAFVVSTLLLAVFIIVRMIFGVKVLSFGIFNELTSTPVGTWNNLGIFFGIATLLSLMTYQMLRTSRLVKILLSLALLVSLFFLALINFTTIWMVVGSCSLLYIIYSVFTQTSSDMVSGWVSRIKRIPLYPAIVVIIAVIFSIWSSTVGTYLTNKMKISSIDVRPSLSVTMDIARNTIKTRPLFGSGPNTFVTQWLSYKPNDITTTVFWNTDFAYGIGLIPTFAVTTGLIGVLSWLIFFGCYLYLGIKSIFTKIEDYFTRYLVVSSFFISLYLWVMSWVYVPSAVVFILTFFFTGLFMASLYLAGIVGTRVHTFSLNPRLGFVTSFMLVAVFIACGALGYGLYKNSESLWYFQKSSYALNTVGNVSDSEMYMAKAITAVPYDIYYRALAQIELVKLNQVVSQDQTKVKVEDLQKQFSDVLSSAIKAGMSARDADPANYLNWLSLGQIYEAVIPTKVQGAYESAQMAYNEAYRRNPKNPAIAIMFARLEIAKGDLKTARAYVYQAIQAKQNYLDAYFLLSQIEVSDKNLKGAIESVTAASVIDPTNASTFFQLGLLKYNAQDIPGAIVALEQSLKLAPDYANAKYFLGLSYELSNQHAKAIGLFEDLAKTNPESKEVQTILSTLKSGKSLFNNTQTTKAEKNKELPLKENQ
jgi:cytochrome c-type biogenesis protein CcmH/NrfG